MAICFLLIANIVHAEGNGLTVSLFSKHFVSNDVDYNEKNFGLGYTSYKNDVTWQVGFYDNSFDRLSVYGALKFYSFDTSRFNPFIMGGFATGYPDYPIRPFIAGGIDVEVIKTHKLNLMVGPLATSTRPEGQRNYETDYGVLFALQYEKLF